MYKIPRRISKERLIELRKMYVEDNKQLSHELYYHMELQSKGVKYKPRSSDNTYHGRKAIHCLTSIDLNNNIILNIDRKLKDM